MECCLFVFVGFLVGLGFELSAWRLQSSHSAARTTPLVHFALIILEMGARELSVQGRLEPRSF
jgi:hypothetical protein